MIQVEEEENSASASALKRKVFRFDGPTIIYCPTKSMTGEVSAALRTLGIKCDIYHAGLTIDYRKKSQISFINDEIDVKDLTFLTNIITLIIMIKSLKNL